ncbi:MAG: hypothetical protein R3B70_05870 [Polyangiaceae bacterium]
MKNTHPTSGAQAIAPGDIIAGKYRVTSERHDHGRVRVMEVTRLETGSRLAMRVSRPLRAGDGWLGLREAAMNAQRLSNDRAECPIDVAELATDEPFVVTPLLAGTDLGARIARDGGLPVLDVIDIGIQVCEAMADAHRVGVLHCDLRPEKLFLSERDGLPFVSVLMSAISVRSGPHGAPRGLFDVDCRSDIFSLGITLCVLLAGKPPFWHGTHKSPSERTNIVIEYIPLSTTRPELSPALASVLERAHSRYPDDRYQSMTSFALALAPFAPARSRPLLDRISARAAQRP